MTRRASPKRRRSSPVLFIYGEHGQAGERNLNPTYYRSAHEPKMIWKVPGSGHTGGINARPKEYEGA